jgi:hypothetical protein
MNTATTNATNTMLMKGGLGGLLLVATGIVVSEMYPCVFCAEVFDSAFKAAEHMKEVHGFWA